MIQDIHIAFIHKEFPFSGAEKVTLDIANYLCVHGCKVTLLTTRHNEHLYPQGSNRLFKVKILPQHNIKSSKKVANAIRDFVLAHGIHVIVTSRELFYAKWLKTKTDVKLVFQLHSSPYYEFLDIEEKKNNSQWSRLLYGSGLQWLLFQFYRNKYRRIYSWADAYGVLCNAYKQVIINKLQLGSDNKLWVLPNATEIAVPITKNKQKIIVYVGRLSHRDKRIDRILRIWQKAQPLMDGWKLKIVGDGKERKKLQRLATNLQLKQVFFEGQTNHVKRYYDEASILCLTSSIEGWPMSVAEAQANGVVPMVFDSFLGAKDLITTKDEGIRIAPFNETAYAESLVQIGKDSNRLQKMQQQVVQKAKEYSINRSGESWMQMLNHIISLE